MLYSGHLAATALFFFGLVGALLPFISVWDRHIAVIRRRSVYDKTAGQVEILAVLVQGIYALLLGADLLAGGAIDQIMIGPWAVLWQIVTMASALAALCAVIVLLLPSPIKTISGILGGLFALLGQSIACVLIWAFCLGVPLGADVAPEVVNRSFVVILDHQYWPRLGLFIFFAILTALTGAYGVLLCWHIICRKKDDFGRDFYTFVLRMRSRQAAWAGILLLPVSVVIFFIYPLDTARVMEMFPLLEHGAAAVLSLGMLAFPVAVFFWYVMSRTAIPMQRRSLAFLAVLLLWAGMYVALYRF